ncbi:MAG: class I SAM-dependent methyltransferase [Ignavibacteria bacterium]
MGISEIVKPYLRRIKHSLLKKKNPKHVFNKIFSTNKWGSPESVSGIGSTLEQTAVIRNEIPSLLKEFGVKVFLDLPCGDFNWMKEVELDVHKYIGADIIENIIADDNAKYGNDKFDFRVINLIDDSLPDADMILCRDCLVHLNYTQLQKVLDNLHSSRIEYLLTTTFPDRDKNNNIVTGDWRPINLFLAPFNFPEPLKLINENCTEENGAFSDKSLALWRIKDLPATLEI